MSAVYEIIRERLWTALLASVVALGACFFFQRMDGVFYTYLIFDALLSMFYIPLLFVRKRIEGLLFFSLTVAWLCVAWLLAGPATRLAFG